MPRIIKMWLFSALISFTAILMWKGIEWYYDRDTVEEAPITITALDLALSYESDLELSNTLYTGRKVIMSGVVSNKGDAGAYYTVNLVGNIYHIDLSFFDSDEIDELDNISIGDTITIRGNIEGLNLIYVSITDCSID